MLGREKVVSHLICRGIMTFKESVDKVHRCRIFKIQSKFLNVGPQSKLILKGELYHRVHAFRSQICHLNL